MRIPSVSSPLLAVTLILFVAATNVVPSQPSKSENKETVVLLHGLGRGKSILTKLDEWLQNAGFATAIVDYKSIGRSPREIMNDVAAQISAFRLDTHRTVHFAGHSLGGLMIRAYLDSIHLPNLGRVVLIGSPNKGTPFVDYFQDSWIMKLAGPAAAALGTGDRSFPKTLRPPYYPVGVIAGISTTFNNDDFIPGEDDGIVPVESTKIDGMTDFLLLQVSHSSLPRNELVGKQVVRFLRSGSFDHSSAAGK